MARLLLILSLLLAGFVAPRGALAHSGAAGLDTGELVFGASDDVAIDEEALFLSRDEIRLRHVLRNLSDQPVTLDIRFILPPVHYTEEMQQGFSQPPDDPDDLLAFRAWLDGAPIPLSRHLSATSDTGRDVTALLARWGLPANFVTADLDAYQRLYDDLAALPEAAKAELAEAGAVFREEDFIAPSWTTYQEVFWSITLPAGARAELRSRHVPVPVSFVFGLEDLEAGYLNADACLDADFIATAKAALSPPNSGYTLAYYMRYLLASARGWSGPVGQFRLTVDSEDPGALVSVCQDGMVRTGPTTLEWQAKDWHPDHDLTLFFLDPSQE